MEYKLTVTSLNPPYNGKKVHRSNEITVLLDKANDYFRFGEFKLLGYPKSTIIGLEHVQTNLDSDGEFYATICDFDSNLETIKIINISKTPQQEHGFKVYGKQELIQSLKFKTLIATKNMANKDKELITNRWASEELIQSLKFKTLIATKNMAYKDEEPITNRWVSEQLIQSLKFKTLIATKNMAYKDKELIQSLKFKILIATKNMANKDEEPITNRWASEELIQSLKFKTLIATKNMANKDEEPITNRWASEEPQYVVRTEAEEKQKELYDKAKARKARELRYAAIESLQGIYADYCNRFNFPPAVDTMFNQMIGAVMNLKD